MDSKGNQNKGRIAVYQILIKHRGELNEAYMGAIKDCLYEFLGNVPKSDITIRKTNMGRK